MSKQRYVHVALIVLCGVTVTYFQNCAPPAAFESASYEFASEGEIFVVDHEDSDRTLPGHGKVKAETTYEPLLVDRFYLRNLFLDIFGPSAMTSSMNTLLNNAAQMGSLCSIYEDHAVLNSSGARTRNRAMDACSSSSVNYLMAPNIPKPTVTRQALINRVCSDMVTTNATFNYVMKRISADNAPAASPENLLTLFSLFYRSHPAPHQGLIESLQLMFSGPFPARDEWRAVINTVCTSSYWQVL